MNITTITKRTRERAGMVGEQGVSEGVQVILGGCVSDDPGRLDGVRDEDLDRTYSLAAAYTDPDAFWAQVEAHAR